MISDYETQALRYMLGEMDERQRVAFEEKIARFPAARAAVADCGESLAVLSRQAVEVPFFGDVVGAQVTLLLQAARTSLCRNLKHPWAQLRQSLSGHD